jgi:peptide/nickel transport system permease protein
MLRFCARRLGGSLVTLLISSLLIFGSLYLVPGDPAVYLAHGRVTPPQLAALRREYGLDQPFFERYVHWLFGLVHGNFGESLQYHEPAARLIGSRLAVTGTLVAYAAVLIIVAGLALGLIGALRRGSIVDRGVLLFSSAATAAPAFLTVVLLLAVFSVDLHWFPALGAGQGVGDRLWHLTLPAVGLALSAVGLITRVSRTAFLDSLRREHVEVARSRGLPEGSVIRRHVVRNSLGPVATMTGLVVASLVVSTTVVESAFGISGIGSLLDSSVQTLDYPVIQAISLVVVLVFLVCNTAVDLLYPFIDPRLAGWRERA